MRSGSAVAAGLALGLSLLLSGCILQSEAPLIGEPRAALMLGTGAITVDLMQPDDAHPGRWLPAAPPQLTLRSEGRHYLVPDPDHPADPAKAIAVWLMPLDPGHVAVEVADPSGLLYGIAAWDGRVLDLAMLDCDALKAAPGSADWIAFDGSDCHPRPDLTAPPALFAALVPLLPAPTLRVVLAP